MGRPPSRKAVVHQLNTALATDAADEKNYHLRQALQLLGLRGYPLTQE